MTFQVSLLLPTVISVLVSCCYGELIQYTCITVVPGIQMSTDIVVSKYQSSYTDCVVFCLDPVTLWFSASLQGTTCHCHSKLFEASDGIPDSSSSYLKFGSDQEIKSCYEIYACFSKGNGLYSIPKSSGSIDLYCDMDAGGWTVLQRRYDGSLAFNKSYTEYQNGFGDLNEEFWVGLETMAELTKSWDQEVRFDLEDFDGNHVYAVYNTFHVSDVTDNYRLTISDYSGNAGNSMVTHNGMQFSAGITDNDNVAASCVDIYGGGGFWFNACHHVNINGKYNSTIFGEGIIWSTFRGFEYSLKSVTMKIRQK